MQTYSIDAKAADLETLSRRIRDSLGDASARDLARTLLGSLGGLVTNRVRRRFAFMAHPRSGTVYMTKLCSAFGLDVGDDNRMGSDGISSFLIGASENPRWGPDPWGYEFDHRVHLVRNPFAVVSSTLACLTESLKKYMAREAGIDPDMYEPARTVRIYLHWHDRITVRKPTTLMRVEDAPHEMARLLGVDVPASLPPTNVNNRDEQLGGMTAPDFDVKWLADRIPPTDFYALRDLARGYGYSGYGYPV